MVVLLAVALLLAPLGLCLGGGAAMAAAPHMSAMHHASPASASHAGHGAPKHGAVGKIHYCPEYQPPSFVKAGKVAAPDIAPLGTAIAPVALPAPVAFSPAGSVWPRGPSSRPPPLRRTYRIRRQI
jgi:hypothetical protein